MWFTYFYYSQGIRYPPYTDSVWSTVRLPLHYSLSESVLSWQTVTLNKWGWGGCWWTCTTFCLWQLKCHSSRIFVSLHANIFNCGFPKCNKLLLDILFPIWTFCSPSKILFPTVFSPLGPDETWELGAKEFYLLSAATPIVGDCFLFPSFFILGNSNLKSTKYISKSLS